jgi:hypothetical protein
MFNGKKGALSPMILNTVIVVLGAFFMLMFVYYMVEKSTNDSDQLDKIRNFTQPLNNSISDLENTANDVRDTLGNSSLSLVNPVSFLFLIFEGAFYIPLKFLGVIAGAIGALGSMLFPALGGIGATVFGIVITAIMMVLLIELVLSLIKLIRTGESER